MSEPILTWARLTPVRLAFAQFTGCQMRLIVLLSVGHSLFSAESGQKIKMGYVNTVKCPAQVLISLPKKLTF